MRLGQLICSATKGEVQMIGLFQKAKNEYLWILIKLTLVTGVINLNCAEPFAVWLTCIAIVPNLYVCK